MRHPAQQLVPTASAGFPSPELAAHSDGPAPEATERDRVRAAIVHDLTETERLLLLLWYAERMSPEEIGSTLGLSLQRVVALHARVIGRLRRCVNADPDGPPLSH